MYVNGLGMTTIANKLDEMQIKPRYRDNWSKSTISDILKILFISVKSDGPTDRIKTKILTAGWHHGEPKILIVF